MDSRKTVFLAAALILFTGFSAAAPLHVELHQLMGATVTNASHSDVPVKTTGEISVATKPKNLFASVSGEDDLINPGDSASVCEYVDISSYTTDYVSMHLWFSGTWDTGEEGIHGSSAEDKWISTNGYRERVCLDFTAPSSTGTYTISVFEGWSNDNELGEATFDVVKDGDGDEVPDPDDNCPSQYGEEDLNGCPNGEPVIDRLSASDTATVGERVDVSVDARDPDGHGLSYSWSNGDTGSSASYVFESSGQHSVSVTVSDGYDSVSRSVTVMVEAADTDGDGENDDADSCPETPGEGSDGCPIEEKPAENTTDTGGNDDSDSGSTGSVSLFDWILGTILNWF